MGKKILVGGTVVMAIFLAAGAFAQPASPIAKGKVLFSVQGTELSVLAVDTLGFAKGLSGDADAGEPSFFPSASLVGGRATVALGLSDQYALNAAFLWAGGFQKTVPADTGESESKGTITALGVRVGLDRHVPVAKWVSLYGGGGVLWTSTQVKIRVNQGPTSVEYKDPRTSSFSLSGRMGFFVRFKESFGLYGDLGQQLSWVSKKVRGKATALTSSHDGNIGIAVLF